ncbi:MAG: type II-A CRISPR-associated protein Csn2 [Candidatus Izemoplasmatales bacterium]|nr:type II-A CRISPR-associated protein Csn2 [Candidatus Izemoplasmatales bacterium]
MRKLRYYYIDKDFFLDNQKTYQVVIKNPVEFYKFVSFIKLEIENNDSENFCLSRNGDILSLSKYCCLINDVFSLEDVDKKSQTVLQKYIKDHWQNYGIIDEYNELTTRMVQFVSIFKESFDLDIDIEYIDDFEILDFFKFIKIKPIITGDNFLEKLIKYIKLFHQLIGNDIFFICNLSAVLSKEQISLLIKELNYFNISLFMIESYFIDYSSKDIECIIIDEDLCEYYK